MDEDAPKQLTVSALIELLKAYPPDALVFTEGCDCRGEAMSVQVEEDHVIGATGDIELGNVGVIICR